MTPKPPIDQLHATSGNLFQFDGPAGTVVFLVALPLCLGIALASGAPLFAGIVAGIVGGLVVSILSGSELSVSGPAAGLAVITATAITTIGSFRGFLVAVVLSGVLQLLFAALRAGVVGDYVPNSVIKGMLAAIGVLIVLKQIPHALGRDSDYEGNLTIFAGHDNPFTDIVESVLAFSPGAVAITALSLLLLLFWERIAALGPRLLRFVPAPLLVVALGIGLNQLFGLVLPAWQLRDAEHLVRLPVATSVAGFWDLLTFPDFSLLTNQAVLTAALTIAAVGSLETLLSLEAADRLDPYKRISPPNRELFAQGVGNILSGLLGGLPVTSVVVRTSANVYAGGRTWVSAFTHGALLLVSALFIPALLNLTPLCALASILIVVGYKLTRVELYRLAYRDGFSQFLPFIVTVVAVVATDLLKGVLVGLAFGIFYVIRSNHHAAFTIVNQDGWFLMRFNKDVTFVNKADLKARLRAIPEDSTLIIDATRAIYIDHDIHDIIRDFSKLAPYKRIEIQYRNFVDPKPLAVAGAH